MTQSYWSRGTLSITVESPNGDVRRREQFAKPFALIGSHPQCDVVLDGPKIANRSLLITATHRGLGGIVLSTTARRAGRFFPIDQDRPIKLRSFHIGVNLLVEPDAHAPDTKDGHDPNSIWAITWKSAAARQYLQLPNHRPILVGRRPPAHVIIGDERLSAVHCCLYRHHDLLWAIDLCSANGTWVSKSQVACGWIGPGRSIRVGQSRVHFVRLHTDASFDGLHAQTSALVQQRNLLQETCDRHQDQLVQLRRRSEQQQSARAELERHHLDTLLVLRLQHEERARIRRECDAQAAKQRELELEARASAVQLRDLESAQRASAANLEVAHERLEQLRQQASSTEAGRVEAERDLAAARAQLEDIARERDGAKAGCAQLESALEATQVQLGELRQRRDAAENQLREIKSDVAERERILRSAELDASRREVELIAMKAKLRQELQELKRSRERMAQESAKVATHDDPETDYVPTVRVRISDETCLMSPDFVHILDEAIDSHPDVDEA